ncbi:uncharacterized protein LOC141637305 [Silene latifolia]|uniref:uncharacterized protein LOC141637305 n=1 Tax=Silene latifolia TaxID=37657 RepID=UPI003D7715CF
MNCWTPHSKGYTISNGYNWLNGTSPRQNWAPIVWNDWNVPKHSLNSWLILQEGINTRMKLFAYGVSQDDRCSICEAHTETIDHIFNRCDYSCRIQKYIEDWIVRAFPTINELIHTNHNSMKWKALAMIITTYRYMIWRQRNRARVELTLMRPEKLAAEMKMMMQLQVRRRVMLKEDLSEG